MAIDVAVEEVADNLEELAEATRSINTTAVGYFITGVCVGVGVGFYFGYKFNREKIKADAFKKSEEEIESIREMYQIRDERKAMHDAAQQKAVAAAAQEKPSVESIVEEKGYTTPVVVEVHSPRPLPAPVPVRDTEGWISSSSTTGVYGTPSVSLWNYPEELANRTKDEPYVIHQEEFHAAETGYDQVSYTYYAEDDVIVGVDDRPIPHADLVIGQDNLKWGHGTTDADLVHVRNDKLELEMEISRIPGSYEREVLGIEPDESS